MEAVEGGGLQSFNHFGIGEFEQARTPTVASIQAYSTSMTPPPTTISVRCPRGEAESTILAGAGAVGSDQSCYENCQVEDAENCFEDCERSCLG